MVLQSKGKRDEMVQLLTNPETEFRNRDYNPPKQIRIEKMEPFIPHFLDFFSLS